MRDKPSVAICLPSGTDWKGQTAFDLFCAGVTTGAHVDFKPMNIRGADVAEARNQMTGLAVEHGFDWLWFIDADMKFPPDSLLRLLKHDLDIVGADYRLRTPPFPRIGLVVDPSDPSGTTYMLPPEDEPKTGLVERALLGLGMLLVRGTVFRDWEPPWFARIWDMRNARSDNPRGFGTDDAFFLANARHRGFKVWCDLDLSAEVEHIGEMSVPWNLGGRK